MGAIGGKSRVLPEVSRYAEQTKVTDPGPFDSDYADLPGTVPELVAVIQKLYMHIHWARRYGATPSDEQQSHVRARLVSRILWKLKEMDPSPLIVPRSADRRFFGNCRDFSVLLASMLRHRGVPARARCGFGTYFLPGHFEDHWVCEYWDGQRWVTVDAQLDEFQRKTLEISFDPLDMPPGRFLNASDAWLRCREGREAADKFGIFDMRGLWFIRGNLLRELAALNEAEMLPWDVWGLMSEDEAAPAPDRLRLLDGVARALAVGDEAGIVRLYRENPELRAPAEMIARGI